MLKKKIWWAPKISSLVAGHVPAHHALLQHITPVYATNTHIRAAQHNSHLLSVCAVANRRQHRAAENRLRHTVLHENPSFPWADPSLFCINANYIILSGMQIRLDEAMADHLYRSVLHCSKSTRIEHLGTPQLCAFKNLISFFIQDASDEIQILMWKCILVSFEVNGAAI